MKIVKAIFVCICALVVLAAGFFLFDKQFKWGLFDDFFGKGLQLEKTANVVSQIRSISEFTSACYYEELVISDEKASENTINSLSQLISNKSVSTDEICLIAKGKVRAGYDLSKVANEDVIVSKDTLILTLPQTEIFDIIVNPSNYEVFVEEGKWSHEQVAALQKDARNQIEKDALKSGLLEKADAFGRERLTELFKAFGFSTVILH